MGGSVRGFGAGMAAKQVPQRIKSPSPGSRKTQVTMHQRKALRVFVEVSGN